MGFFEGLDAEAYDRKYRDRDLLRRIFGYFRPQRGRMLVVGVFTILISFASASSVVIISWGTDMVRQDPSLQNIFLVAGLGFLLGVFIWLANWVARRQATVAIAGVLLKLATDAFESAVGHDLSFYDDYSSGRIVSRITSDTQDFGQLVTIVTDVASQVIEAVVLGVILWRIDWKLTLIILAFLPLLFIFGILFRKIARRVTQQGMRAIANVNATIKETVSGIAVAKNFRQEQSIFETFNEANQTSYRVNWKRGFTLNWVFPVLNAVAGLATALMVYAGGLTVAQGIVTAGAWYLFILSLDRFMFPIMNISSFWSSIQNGLSASERVFALIDAEPAVVQTGSADPGQAEGADRF